MSGRSPLSSLDMLEKNVIHYKNSPMQYTEIFFQKKKIENFIGKILIFLIFSLKTYIVGTGLNHLSEVVLTSTHNVGFG